MDARSPSKMPPFRRRPAACRTPSSGAGRDPLIGHRGDDALAIPRAEDRAVDDGQPVSVEPEAPFLVGARPALVPGDLDMMDHLARADAVAARIGGEPLEKGERLLIGRREALRPPPL